VTLGVFDGVHLGHRAILDEVVTWARALGGEAWAITFDNHPDSVLRGAAPPAILTFEHRMRLFEACGLDACWILHFDDEIRRLPAETFVARLFVERLAAAGVVLGEGAHFGKEGRGDTRLLREIGLRLGFETRVRPVARVDGVAVSSTRIREAVRAGNLDAARGMLGRPFSVLSPVVRGDGRGRTIGVPTANLGGGLELLPPRGVYRTSAVVSGIAYPAVTNVGTRPTFREDGDARRVTVETHLLDFAGELLGNTIEVLFLEKLRDERAFASVEALVHQIRIDIARVKEAAGRAGARPEKDLTCRRGGL